MNELPSGTVTFLRTDIEGSTRLLQELGEAYAEALVFWGDRALELRGAEASPAARAHLLTEVSWGHHLRGEHDEAVVAAEQATRRLSDVGDQEGRALSLVWLAGALGNTGRESEAVAMLQEALRLLEEFGPAGETWRALHGLGEMELDRGNLAAARGHLERAVREAGDRVGMQRNALDHGLGDLALVEGDAARARASYRDALGAAVKLDDFYLVVHCLGGLAAADAREGKAADAAAGWAMAARYGELRGVKLAAHVRDRYRDCISSVPPELLAAAREKWAGADAAAVETAASAP